MELGTLHRRSLILLAVLAGVVHAGEPLGTGFSYQGQLKESGVPFNGSADMVFGLFDSESGGNPIGGAIPLADVAVVNGLFTVELDFGTSPFNGQAVWLEVSVEGVILAPRQALTPAPYALFALDGPGSGTTPWLSSGPNISYVDGNVGIGTTQPVDMLDLRHTSEGGISILGDDDHQDSHLILGQDPTHYMKLEYDGTTDTLDVIANNGTGEGAPFMSIQRAAGNVGIGTTSPKQRLHNTGAYYGVGDLRLHAFEGDGAEGTAFVQARDDSGTSAINLRLRTQLNGQVVNTMHLGANGRVGIGTTAPLNQLHVVGGTDASLTGGGYIQAGNTAGANVVIDDNEIMARNNGAVSNLHINNNGGDVIFGGAIDIGLEIVTVVENNDFVFAFCPAGKRVIGGGCSSLSTDDPLQTSKPSGITGWHCEYDQGVFGGGEVRARAICANVK